MPRTNLILSATSIARVSMEPQALGQRATVTTAPRSRDEHVDALAAEDHQVDSLPSAQCAVMNTMVMAAHSASVTVGKYRPARQVELGPLISIWNLRFAPPESPEARHWALCIYVLLQAEARRMYPRWFPQTDGWLREQAWSSLWLAWCRRPPTRAAHHFEDERQITAYVHVSLRHTLLSLLRRRRRRAQLEDIHRTGLNDGNVIAAPDDPLERVQESAALERSLAFLDEVLPLLLWSLRPARGAEVRRILTERMGITHGHLAFSSCVDRIVSDEGISARQAANRLRQQYGRARREILHQLKDHNDLIKATNHDVTQLERIVCRVFSDRA